MTKNNISVNNFAVSISDLQEFSKYIKDENSDKSFSNFINKKRGTENQKYRIIGDIFNESIDLTNADFGNSIFENVIFNNNISLTGASFIESTLYNCRFISNIKLTDVSFSYNPLLMNTFIDADISKAKFNLDNYNLFIHKVSDSDLIEYCNILDRKQSINDFIKSKYSSKYPNDGVLITDLSGRYIDGKKINLENADFSESILSGTRFTNIDVNNLILRDCNLDYADLGNMIVKNIDLRGSSIIKVIGGARFSECKLSLSPSIEIDDIKNQDRLDPSESFDRLISKTIKIEKPILDPLYHYRDNIDEIPILYKCSISDIDQYLATDKSENFTNFIMNKYPISDYIIPDLSGLDLRKKDFTGACFTSCNFTYSDLRGAILEGGDFTGSNFSCTNLSGNIKRDFESRHAKDGLSYIEKLLLKSAYKIARSIDSVLKKVVLNNDLLSVGDNHITNAKRAKFDNCVFTRAKTNLVDFSDSSMNNIILEDSFLSGSNLSGVNANAARLNNSLMRNIKAAKAKFNKSSFIAVDATGADLQEVKVNSSNLTGARLENANLSEAEITNSVVEDVDLRFTNLTNSDLRCSVISGKTNEETNLTEANLDGADIGRLKTIDKKDSRPILKNTKFENSVPSKKVKELKKIRENRDIETKIKYYMKIVNDYISDNIYSIMSYESISNIFSNKLLFASICLISTLSIVSVISGVMSMILPQAVVTCILGISVMPILVVSGILSVYATNLIVDAITSDEKEQDNDEKIDRADEIVIEIGPEVNEQEKMPDQEMDKLVTIETASSKHTENIEKERRLNNQKSR